MQPASTHYVQEGGFSFKNFKIQRDVVTPRKVPVPEEDDEAELLKIVKPVDIRPVTDGWFRTLTFFNKAESKSIHLIICKIAKA